MHERKFPKSSKLSESASFACVEIAEASMPFAVARPFVDDLIDKNTIPKVLNISAYHSVLAIVLYKLLLKERYSYCTRKGHAGAIMFIINTVSQITVIFRVTT